MSVAFEFFLSISPRKFAREKRQLRRPSMNQRADKPTRAGNGHFVPGQSGNPKGKAPGTRNRATVLRALMRDGDEDAIGRVLIDRALGGGPVAARFLIESLNPKPRQRTITLDLPEGADAAAIFQAAAKAMATSEISPEEAISIVRFAAEGQRMVQASAEIQRASAARREVAVCAATMEEAASPDMPAARPRRRALAGRLACIPPANPRSEMRLDTPLPDLPPQGRTELELGSLNRCRLHNGASSPLPGQGWEAG
jgi:hypothetical protein